MLVVIDMYFPKTMQGNTEKLRKSLSGRILNMDIIINSRIIMREKKLPISHYPFQFLQSQKIYM